MNAQTIFTLLGGLGIFLFAIELMGNSLKLLAGNRMKTFIEKTTNTPLKGIFVGMIVTILIQSSSATTALTVGLVRAGLMSLPQAIGVIMGANIGTTITAFLVGLKISEYSLLIVGIGAIMLFFFKKEIIKNLGSCLLGFGLLFFGLELMGDSMGVFAESDTAIRLFENLSHNPILGLLIGTLVTAVIQSSSAATGILQTLYAQGTITILACLPILIGSNIGTTVTALLSSVGGTVSAKRTAFIHVLFNLVGALIFMILLKPYSWIVGSIETNFLATIGASKEMTLAIAHMIFNLTTTLVLYWFINQMVKLACRVIKDDKKEFSYREILSQEELINESPVIALSFAKKAIIHMADLVTEFFDITTKYSFNRNDNDFNKAKEIEEHIDSLDVEIHDYLIEITSKEISDSDSKLISNYLNAIRDLERIGDHCMNIFEFFEERYNDDQNSLSPQGENDLKELYSLLKTMLDNAIQAFTTEDKKPALNVVESEDLVDSLEKKFRKRHILRLNSGECSINKVDNFFDILANLERIGDHLSNIALSIFDENFFSNEELQTSN